MTARVACPCCGRSVALTPWGRVYQHGYSFCDTAADRRYCECPGSHRTPEDARKMKEKRDAREDS